MLVFEFVYLPLSHLWRAEAHSRLGHPTEAAANYEAFIALWKDCDPELLPMLQLARQRLGALGAQNEPASSNAQPR